MPAPREPDASARFDPVLTPNGRLVLREAEAGDVLDRDLARRLVAAFAPGPGEGLLQLGAGEVGRPLPPALHFWRDFAGRYVTALCIRPDPEDDGGHDEVPPPAPDELAALVHDAPPMTGGEYLTAAVLDALWRAIDGAFVARRAALGASVQDLLHGFHPNWNRVGRVHFHLAENRKDPEAPFAFMATYTTRLSAHAAAQHVPLGQALREYAGAANRERLLSLLVPVQRAAEACAWLRTLVESGEIFHPLRWTPREAVCMLRDLAALEAAGVVVRMPAAWGQNRPARPQVTATIGGAAPSRVGRDAMLDFRLDVALDGEPLTVAEIADLLRSSDGLAMIRGRWVEVDPTRLRRAMDRYREAERLAKRQGVTFAEAMRLLAGGDGGGADGDLRDADWSAVVAGPWLRQTLAGLRGPEGLADVDPGPGLRGTLRPYQQVGLRWLVLLSRLGLGACLADDMGLGKTIQVLALLLVRKAHGDAGGRPSLLVAPASLLANWADEIGRFAPGLACVVAHPSRMPAAHRKQPPPGHLEGIDLVITSYGSLLRMPWLVDTSWDLVVLDEAQAIKNPDARQSREARRLQGRARIALTGTPVENRLGDLWSLFDFINPGLLGSSREFSAFVKRLAERPHHAYAPLRDLVRPYILRRMKTDRAVIADLPDKTEVKAFCGLTRKQAVLYQAAVHELAEELDGLDGIRRKGVVLSFLMRFKQVCNHPSQWLGDGAWVETDSGKFARLREVAEVVASRQEKMLVFTQFRETTGPLAAFLGAVFGRPGLILHGATPVRQRAGLVGRFQRDEAVPFFVLSLKAGGSGLNLTAASHVVHFDRWWNPAVENQATDRAFRIGQTRNVLVHKFLCQGTVEEKIDQLIESKRQLSRDILEGGAEALLTEMGDEELLRLVALDVKAALQEV